MDFPLSGIYEHYKGRGYQLLFIARHTETDETLVIYIPLYDDPAHKGPRVQARPLSMWAEEVEHEGRRVPRFKFLGVVA